MFYDIFFGMRERKPGGVLNILLRACRCARVWTVRKRAGTVKIPAGWSGKYLWKDGILYRMTRKKIRKYSPRNGKNVRSGGKFIPKNEDFSFEKPREKYENDENGEKNFFPCTGKNMKIIPMARKKCLKLGNGKRKKRIFLLKKFQESKKIMETDRKFSQLHIKKAGKIIPTKRKNLRKRMIRMKKQQQIFSQTDGKIQKCTGKEAEKFIESSEKSMKNIRPIGINSIIDGRSG